MKYEKINPQLFIENRKKFIAQMKPNSIAIFRSNYEFVKNGDASLDFKQNSDLKYTFGAAGLKLDSYSKNIQRIPIETKNYSAEEILKNEIIYYQVLKMLGKNTIKRS